MPQEYGTGNIFLSTEPGTLFCNIFYLAKTYALGRGLKGLNRWSGLLSLDKKFKKEKKHN